MNPPVVSQAYALTVVQLGGVSPATYTLETAATLSGMHPEMLRYYCRLGVLGDSRARSETDPTFDDDAIYELRQFEAYRRQHGVDRQTLRLLCGLRREVERLQTEVRFLRGP